MNVGRRGVYPEVGAGGYSSVDGNVEFYGRINALLSPQMTVLDFGAGRGYMTAEDVVEYRRSLRILKGKARLVVGADIDSAVAGNPSVDCSVLVQESAPLPFRTACIDMIVSDFTFEHIADPGPVTQELDRVLKPGGWMCARTPNRWGYIALGSSIVPNRLHAYVLRVLQPDRASEDIFPTTYRMNTLASIKEYFPATRYDDYSYYYDAEPAYFGSSVGLNRIARSALRVVPMRCSALLMIFKRKKP